MSRVQEGAFDPGLPPPETVKPEHQAEAAPQPTETFREKCLRRLREQQAGEAKALDWYGQLAGNLDPGDAMQWTPSQLAEARQAVQDMQNRQAAADADRFEAAAMAAVGQPTARLKHIISYVSEHSNEQGIVFHFEDVRHVLGLKFHRRMTAIDLISELRQAADEIEAKVR